MSSPLAIDRPRRISTAVFVDFDNVYLGLRNLDPGAAQAFASNPGAWLDALTAGEDDDGGFTRRFLVRKCYLNPTREFAQYRSEFTRAGFEVVDCPSLTQQGKSGADINLVLDAVDALGSTTRFDEFLVLSADADFTPLLRRFRAADRRVTVVTAGLAASAYRAVADVVITGDSFAALVLAALPTASAEPGAPATPVAPPPPSASGRAPIMPVTDPTTRPSPGTDAAATAVRRQVAEAAEPVVSAAVAQTALSADPGIAQSRWHGAGSFAAWVKRALPELQIGGATPGWVWDPTRHDESDIPDAPMPPSRAHLSPLQLQVVSVTDIPPLTQAAFRGLIDRLAEDLAAHPFNRTETSKRVRDACAKAGEATPRSAVNIVLNSLLYSRVISDGPVSAETIARNWAANVLGLCQGVQMKLTDDQALEIAEWVSGGITPASAGLNEATPTLAG